MARKNVAANRFEQYLFFGLILFFGLVTIALTYKVATGPSTENRSKAAGTDAILKSWEFNTVGNFEGWKLGSSMSGGVGSNTLNANRRASGTDVNAYVLNDSVGVGTTVPAGGKSLKIRMSVRKPTPTPTPGGTASKIDAVNLDIDALAEVGTVGVGSTAPSGSFSFPLYYNSTGGTFVGWTKLTDIQGAIDGVFKEYVIPFTDPKLFFLTGVKLNTSGLTYPDRVRIDYVRLVIPPPATPTPTPSPLPIQSDAKRVFISSTLYNGNLGGLNGADAKCQARANAVGLGGIWKAWLSDSVTSASNRLNHYANKYIRLDGVVIANNWTDLTDGSLQNSLNVKETMGTLDLYTWTGTSASGASQSTVSTNSCNNWTANVNTSLGYFGSSYEKTARWTETGARNGCATSMPLYCIEQ